MINRFVEQLKGISGGVAMALNTLVCGTALYVVALFKALMPKKSWRNAVRHRLAAIAETWIAFNNRIFTGYRSIEWDIQIPETLDRNGCYVINCNHQSWVDILVLQRVFNRRAPFMRFFIKQQLIWVPLLGIAWWALDFPFMRRYSREEILRNPRLKERDLETTRRVCARFRDIPVSIMNFMEGTRFSEPKRRAQKSPYRYLLKPRIGGLGEVLYAFDEKLDALVDVTIVYPDGTPSFWDLLCGRVQRVVVIAREVDIPESLRGKNFRADPTVRAELKAWAARLWAEKDRVLAMMKQSRPVPEGP